MTNSTINFQPLLSNELVKARPLVQSDFDGLYRAASDPLIWEQHPNKNRYQLADFKNYFKGGIESGGAFLVMDADTEEIFGSSRYSDFITETSTVSIGYTFFVRKCWGKGYNKALKQLMLDHIFQYVQNVNFFIGAVNKRSQISIQKMGAIKIGEVEMAYYGEPAKLDFIYAITKDQWFHQRSKE
ncbi:MAG TPA: GNAT family N-acetyltransferase [Chitinophagaceae bacterium]|nr:GNAT family N-acetyltransferase [Chitinophagaceae bacterium]HQX96532.1 GNAT family N-acetyltransferase [Chitinophagaceae bacterium]HQZ50118.1 GNAT family N-acetyltransferase [Chitinophagaceae bacterium]HRA12511.1 GNAT family N-acetyltransferase [Chitinophagaceae bacterium]